MPTKPSQIQNPEDEPAVRAAYITGSSARKAALITASGAILAALIAGLWLWMTKPTFSIEKKKFVGRVSDKGTGKSIRSAKISLESEGVPSIIFTDSEGIFSFLLNDSNKEIRVRVEATNYEDYDRRITPSENPGTLEIRLEPVKNVLLSSSPSPTSSPQSPLMRVRSAVPKSQNRINQSMSNSPGGIQAGGDVTIGGDQKQKNLK